MMRATRIAILMAVALLTFTHRSDGQAARPLAEQVRLAAAMPRGALVYVQARDLGALLKTWLAAPAREKFYKSASFEQFSRSGIYLKFKSRFEDFGKAVGFGIDEARLAEIAGGASAIALYDIGRLEVVFVTEAPRERAIATVLFRQAPQFQERSAEGSPYYVRDVTTDGGRLSQQFCFAYAGGKLIVTTAEGLMIRALGHVKSGGAEALHTDVLALAQRAEGFAAGDLTMWLDQAKLNRNRYFINYWIHGNVSAAHRDSLAKIETGLVDLRLTPQGMDERRWFTVAGEAGQGAARQPAALLRLAPADAQLVEARAGGDGAGEAAAHALFGQLPEPTPPETEPDYTRSNPLGGGRAGRYSNLDRRFDQDVDDEHAPGKRPETRRPATAPPQPAGPGVAAAVAALAPETWGMVARSRMETGRPFARFERAVVLELRDAAALDRQALERAIAGEMRARFVVAGVDPGLAWQDDAGVRYLAQSLLEQGAAYAVAGNFLVLASGRELVKDILRAASAGAPPRADGPADYVALVRVAQARPVFDGLMMKLDGKSAEAPAAADQEEEAQREIKFFSDNLSSLVAALAVRDVRVERRTAGGLLTERVVYAW